MDINYSMSLLTENSIRIQVKFYTTQTKKGSNRKHKINENQQFRKAIG